MSANFTPELSGYSGIQPFRFWCQKVMPLTYDDSLSYYELLCKVVDYLNNAISDLATAEDNIGELANAYDLLQGYVNDKLEELETYMNTYFDNLDVQDEIDHKLDAMVTSGEMTTLISPLVPDIITNWLTENVTPVGGAVVVDESLTISGAAADAKVVGDALKIIGIPPTLTWKIGSLGSSGQSLSYKNSIVTNTIKVNNGDTVTPHAGFSLRVFTYNADGTFVNRSSWITSAKTFTATSYVKLLLADTAHRETYTYVLTDTSYADDIDININLGTVKDAVITLEKPIMYVSASGSDDNPGTSYLPVATVDKALALGAKTVRVMGGKYYQRINLLNSSFPEVSIVKDEIDKAVTFYEPNCLLTDSASLLDGYTRVLTSSVSASLSANNLWIYQEGVADEDTLISDSERQPEQRGLTYRCRDTKIVKCTAETLEGALTEIESSEAYKWFINSGTLYFTCPEDVSVTNPIVASLNHGLFDNTAEKQINMCGIDVKYMYINVSGTIGSNISNCSVNNVFGDGCFRYDSAVGVTFTKCEAGRCLGTSTTGDGFNAHSSNTGNADAHQTTAVLIDCWSHDNNDEGYSDHERCETTVIGGVFEHNGNGGLTPASGSHCSCYNVISQSNGDGFSVINPAAEAEGGVGSQFNCFNCVSINNAYTGYKALSEGNKINLFGCYSIGDNVAFYNGLSSEMNLYNCYASDYTTLKNGTVTVKNSTLVT